MANDSDTIKGSRPYSESCIVLVSEPTPYPYELLAARFLGCGVTFASVVSIGHYLGGSIGLSSSYPIRSRIFGSSIVFIASIYCRQASIAFEKLLLNESKHNLSKSFTLFDEARILFLKTHGIEGEFSENVIAGFLGFFLFLLLGGSPWRILPSDIQKPGAYHQRTGSCDACEKYATTSIRESINQMGKIHGCHSCGFRGLVNMSYRTKFVKWLEHLEFSKLLHLSDSVGIPIKYRFYPQCRDCSQVQAIAVKKTVQSNRKTKPHFVYHAQRFRLYKLTGFALAFLTSFATPV